MQTSRTPPGRGGAADTVGAALPGFGRALTVCALTACAGNAQPAVIPPNSAPEAPLAPNPAAPGSASRAAPDSGTPGTPDAGVLPPIAAASSASTVTPALDAEPATQPLPKGTLVLQLGDSFAAALGVELGKLLKAEGVRSALEYKTASYIPNWSYDGDIPKFVSNYHPDLVLITLGANEIEISKPEQRAAAIRHLVASVGNRPCVWVAPPLWKADNGLLQVIRDNVAPCRYLDSNSLLHDLPRAHDKIHPSPEGRQIWAKTVFDWLARERQSSAVPAPGESPWALKPEAREN